MHTALKNMWASVAIDAGAVLDRDRSGAGDLTLETSGLRPADRSRPSDLTLAGCVGGAACDYMIDFACVISTTPTWSNDPLLPAASEFCRKCGKSTTVDGLPVVREEALVSAVTEAMYDRMNGHGHHMELPTGYSVDPSDPKAWPFLTAFDDPKVYAMRELHAPCEAHFMHPMDDSDALRDVMG
eukprot:jgi/Tetstr1/460526/TSEL_005785.t1